MKQPENIQSWSQAADQHRVTPPSMVWDRIEAHLDQKRKRRPAIFWWLGAALILAAGLIWLNLDPTREPVAGKDSYQLAEVRDEYAAATIPPDEGSGDESLGIEPLTGANAGMISNIPADMPGTHVRRSTPVSPEMHIRSRGAGNSPDHSATPVNNTIPDANNKVNDADRIARNTSAGSAGSESIESRTRPSALGIAERSGNDPGRSPHMIGLLDPLAPLTFQPDRQYNYDLKPIRPGKNVTCYSFKEHRNRFFLDLEGGPGLPLRRLDNRLEGGKLYANKIETEQPWYAYGASIHAGILLKNNIFLYSGLNLTGIKEKFDYQKTGLTQVVITFDPATNQPIDTSVRTGTLINSGENHIRLYQIPVSIGYQKAFNEWSVGVDAGMYFNLSASAGGKLLRGDGSVVKLEDADIYKNRVGMSAQIALTFGYRAGDSWLLYLRPQYVKALRSWTTESSGIDQSYDVIHVNLGVRKFFGKK